MRLFAYALLIAPVTFPYVGAAQSIPFVEDDTSVLTLDAFPSLAALWSDADSDGDLDLLVTGIIPDTPPGFGAFYRNTGNGTFARFWFQTNEDLGAITNSGAWADLDNDGDLDLVTSSLSDGSVLVRVRTNKLSGPLYAFRRTAMDDFEDQRDVSLADYDGDGLLDGVIVRRFGFRNGLIHNNGRLDGLFWDSILSGDVYDEELDSSIACWGDVNNDGLPELYITNAEGLNSYFVNQGGTLIRELFAGNVLIGDSGTGCAWGDYDNDGDLDLVATTKGDESVGDYLFRNDGGIFTTVPFESRIFDTRGIAWGDVDNDGDLDLVASRFTDTNAHTLYLNDGAGELTAIDFGETHYNTALTLVDDDEDGDLDLYVVNGGYGFNRRNQLYRNTTDGAANWIQFELRRESGTNRFGVGAHVYVYATVGGQPQVMLRPMHTHSGRRAQSGYRMHFGLGDAVEVDSLVVEWPQGVGEDRTVLYSLAANQIITVTGATALATPSALAAVQMPGSFAILGIYPNPSVGAVTLSVQMGNNLPVRVKVFDVLGRQVRAFEAVGVSGTQAQLRWDGKDEQGRAVSSGLYAIRVSQGEVEHIARVTVLR